MSRILPFELKSYILSYLPFIQIKSLNIVKDGLVSILHLRYNLDSAVGNRLMRYSLLPPSLVFLKIAAIFGESAPEEELFFNPMLNAVSAILKNNLETLIYYCRRIDFHNNLSLLDTYLSLAIKYAGTEIIYLIKALCAVFSPIPRSTEQIKNLRPFYDPNYPVYGFNNPSDFGSDIYTILVHALNAFDFPKLYAMIFQLVSYGSIRLSYQHNYLRIWTYLLISLAKAFYRVILYYFI